MQVSLLPSTNENIRALNRKNLREVKIVVSRRFSPLTASSSWFCEALSELQGDLKNE